MAPIATTDSTPARVRGVQWRRFGEDGMLLEPASGAFAQVDAVGMAIWDHVDGDRTIGEIAARLAEEFDIAPDEIADDVAAFLSGLGGAGLVTFDR